MRSLSHSASPIRLTALLATVGVALLVAAAAPAQAQQIANRTILNTLLSGSGGGSLDTFESYNVVDGDISYQNSSSLNASTVINGQGPGLVSAGVTYSTSVSGLFIAGPNYYGQASKDLLVSGSTLRIDFSTFVSAYGLDLTVLQGNPDTTIVRTYATNGTLLNTSSSIVLTAISDPSALTFYGFQNGAGIGAVEIQGFNNEFSPVIDNIQFGKASASTAAPEPGSLALLLPTLGTAGMVIRRRRK